MILCFCCSISCFSSLFIYYSFKNISSLQLKIIQILFLFLSASQVFSLDLDAVSWFQWCLILFFNFVIHVFVNLIIFLNYIYNLLEMILHSWFHFLHYCTQIILLTTVVLNCSDSYWCNISNIFSLSNSFIHFAHLFINDMLSTSFILFWALL